MGDKMVAATVARLTEQWQGIHWVFYNAIDNNQARHHPDVVAMSWPTNLQ